MNACMIENILKSIFDREMGMIIHLFFFKLNVLNVRMIAGL